MFLEGIKAHATSIDFFESDARENLADRSLSETLSGFTGANFLTADKTAV